MSDTDGGAPAPDAPKFVTEELLNKAISGRLGEFQKRLDKQFEGVTKTLAERLESLQAPASTPDKPSDGKTSPEMAAMAKRLEDAEKRIRTAEEARENAERRQREESARVEVLSHLDGIIRPETREVVSDYLFRRVSFGEDGAPVIKLSRDPSDVGLPLSDGISGFLKSKEAAPFLPAPSATAPKQAGSKFGRQSPGVVPQYDKPATTDEEKVRRAMERAAALKSQLGSD